MAFARTTAVAGAGTVACTSTTTVTGTGTSFAFGVASIPTGTQARVGGTITVAGVTKTIVSIQSATSLTTDTAFGTFTGSAFTVQTGIDQTGTDTLNLSVSSVAGMTITNRADLYRTFDVQGNDLTINGTLIVDSTVAQLRNDGSVNNRLTVVGSINGGELRFNGQRAAAGNGPFPYAGLDWLGTNGMGGATALNSTNSLYPAKLTLIDACIRFGADWFTVSFNNFARITTQGDECWIFCAKGTGTVQARLRLNNNTPVIDFQAKQTWVGVWMNFGASQISLKGFTPIATDGPEINVDTITVVSRITLEDYNTSYIQAAYYAGSQIVLYGGAWTRIKNNLLGSNIVWRSANAAVGSYNILELSKQVKATAKDAAGNLLSDGYFYFTPTGSNTAGIRPKGVTTDVTFDLSQKNLLLTSGSAETEFVYAWDFSIQSANESSYNYFCSGQTKGAETHPAFVSRYGYDKQPITLALNGNGTFEATTVHASLPTTDKVIANAAAITGISVNFPTRSIVVTANRTIQQIYDVYQYQLNQTANLTYSNECTVTGSQTSYTSWNIVVMPGGNIADSGTFTNIYADTITLANSATMPYLFNAGGVLQGSGFLMPTTVLGVLDTYSGAGTITALYSSLVGASVTVRLQAVTATGVAAIWHPGTSATELFQTNNTGSAAFYDVYYPPGSVGLVKNYARELYGSQRVSGSITLVAGLNVISFVDIPDVGITEATLATVNAYTAIEGPSKFYDRTAAFRLTEQGIKLGQIVTRSGTALEIGTFSHVINSAAASVYALVGSVITTKSSTYAADTKYVTEIATPPATITAASTEVITIAREDANGDSQVTIQAAGVSTFEIWKITDATNPDNYATGTLVATVGIGTFRFLSANGFKFVIRDQTTNYRVVVEAEKGIYTAELFFGAQVQLAQAAEVSQINTKVDILTNNVAAVPAAVLAAEVEPTIDVAESLRLYNAVLGGKVSGAGSGVETFRDINDTKDRVVADVDSSGNRTSITRNLT
jgi:hypothetical protein